MNEGESGGVQGLRAWVADATERAAGLVRRVPKEPVSAAEFEGPIAELSRLRRLLDHDPALLGTVTLGLGSLLATRYGSGYGTAQDREQADRLLGEVRDPTTAAGSRMPEQGRQWAAVFQIMVSDLALPGVAVGRPPDLWSVIDRALRTGPDERAAEAEQLGALVTDVEQLPVPPEVRERLRTVRQVFSDVSRDGALDPATLLPFLPADWPLTDQIRMVLDLVGPGPDPATPQPADPEPEAERETGPVDATVTGAWLTALLGLTEAARTGEPETLSRLLQRLGADLDRLPEGHDRAREIESVVRMVLPMGELLGGSHLDATVAHGHTELLAQHVERLPADDPFREFSVAARVGGLLGRLHAVEGTEQEDDLRSVVRELDALDRSTPADHPFRTVVVLAHGTALTLLGQLTRDHDTLAQGLALQEATLTDGDSPLGLALPQALKTTFRDGLRAARAVVSRNPDLIPGPTPPPLDASADTLYGSALVSGLRHSVTEDRADLDAAISALERARDHLRQGRSARMAADALWQLAENYRLRGQRTHDPADADAATDAALESLRALAGDVVLQAGPDHGLLAARSGVDRGVWAARWAAYRGRVEEAVAALELGRALVLQAASTSRAVPDLLRERGHQELAEAWRAAEQRNGQEPDALPRDLPSSLRRRALTALGHRDPDGVLFRTPTVDELRDGVAEGDADALVYLLAGEEDSPGVAIMVGPDTGTGVLALPLLSGENSGPLERYLDASTAYQNHPEAPAAARTWEDALVALCDWAGDAAVVPVLAGVAQRLAANEERRRDRPGPPRIVLVPCGRLGLVPWHAARLPDEAPHTHACQAVVISYAASGRQFLHTVRRGRRAPAAAPVLVADPSMSLPHAELEVAALQRALYPGARLYGEFYEPPAAPAAAGTPGDLLSALHDAPSLLHVACHGSAGTDPTTSALHLADLGDPAGPPPAGTDGRPHPALLTVTRLLESPAGEPEAADGPLVVLSACETDLSKRDHDEALTLTTAFVAGGARDVVGSRWATRDAATALMMAVFHHYLAVGGLSPVDALRAAQMWMLDPERQNPGSLSGKLLDELESGPELHRLPAWAAFIHQGHPGPAAPRGA